MKKFLITSVIAVLIGGAAFAADPTNVVSSVNVVGYNQITLLPSNKYVQVALQFDNPSNTVQNLFPNMPNGSKAYFWTTNQVYVTCSRGPANWGTTGTNVLRVGQYYLYQSTTVRTNVNELKPYTLEW
jgi:opacity protein-like surface antigen